jgi:geranylgeranyl pyrophosphate synthase
LVQGLDERTASIYAPIRSQLSLVEERLGNLRHTSPDYLEPLLDYVLDSGGKRVRPAITLLASQFYPHNPENPIIMAGAVELLHLATLIHDDTVDNSDLRRGRPTVSNRWGKQVAVLLGDYLFATSATFVCDTQNVRVIRRFSETIMELASGEMAEFFDTFKLEQAQERYHDRIYRKTASLFRTAGETGAILGDAPEPQVQALHSYGYNIGMAFQIVDDLLDVQGDAAELGKPVGNDLLQGVLTLPSIMLMEKYPDDNPVKDLFNDRTADGKLRRVLDMINNSGIVDDCHVIIREYCEKAARSLDILPDCEARRSLLALPEYIRERSR